MGAGRPSKRKFIMGNGTRPSKAGYPPHPEKNPPPSFRHKSMPEWGFGFWFGEGGELFYQGWVINQLEVIKSSDSRPARNLHIPNIEEVLSP